MKMNPPVHEIDDELNIEDDEEVYEIEDLEELELLEQQLANDDDSMDLEVDDGEGVFQATTIFAEHKDSVFSVALSPSQNIASSGGEDDLAYVWDTETGATLFKCINHKDSVTNVTFSHDGCFLATADMGGFIQVWKVAEKSRVWEFECNEVNWLIWHTSSHILFAGTLTGEVWMWLIPRGDAKSLSCSGVGTECGALMQDGKRLCVGFADGAIKLFDLKAGKTVHTFSCHDKPITSVSTHNDNILVLSGSVDGNVQLYSAVSGKNIASLNCNRGDGADEEKDVVEVVSFCPVLLNLAVIATLSGLLTIWDITAQTIRHHIEQACGTTTIRWHPTLPYFFAAGLDGRVRVYDVRSGELKAKFAGHSKTILSCDISRDGSKLITGSDDGTTRIFNIEFMVS